MYCFSGQNQRTVELEVTQVYHEHISFPFSFSVLQQQQKVHKSQYYTKEFKYSSTTLCNSQYKNEQTLPTQIFS